MAEWKIAYTDDGRPWILTETAGPQQLSARDEVYEILLSGDGQLVVFVRSPLNGGEPLPSEIYVVNADASGERLLMSSEDFDALYPHEGFLHNDLGSISFIPGTHQLMLNTRGIPEGPGLIKYDDLLRLDADSGELVTLLPPGQGGDFTIAPDGSRVALVQPVSFHLANPDGTGLLTDVITFESLITYSEFQFYVQPQWSADGSQVAVVIPSADILAEDPAADIWRLSADGSEVTLLASMPGDFFFTERTERSSLSPDFTQVVYRQSASGNRTLMTANVGGPGVAYDENVLEWWGWLPNGGSFAYAKGDPMTGLLGTPGMAPSPLLTGNRPRWITSTSFYYLQGSIGSWTLRRGAVGDSHEDIVSPSGDFVRFDFVHP
jgi:hypothetical protein